MEQVIEGAVYIMCIVFIKTLSWIPVILSFVLVFNVFKKNNKKSNFDKIVFIINFLVMLILAVSNTFIFF